MLLLCYTCSLLGTASCVHPILTQGRAKDSTKVTCATNLVSPPTSVTHTCTHMLEILMVHNLG